MPWDGSFYEPPGPNEGHCSFSKQNTLRANSSIMASAARSERTCPSQSRLLLRDFSRLPGPNGELAPRLEKMTKARQIAGGGGGGGTAPHYDISSRALESLRLSKISDHFPKTSKCPQSSVPKTFEHFRSYFR